MVVMRDRPTKPLAPIPRYPTTTQKILPWTKMCRLKLWSLQWTLPSLFLRSHQQKKSQQFHTRGQPFRFNSNTFSLRNLTQCLFLPSQTRTSNFGLLIRSTPLNGSKPCHRFISPVTLPLPSTILSTSLIANLPHPVAGIEFFP